MDRAQLGFLHGFGGPRRRASGPAAGGGRGGRSPLPAFRGHGDGYFAGVLVPARAGPVRAGAPIVRRRRRDLPARPQHLGVRTPAPAPPFRVSVLGGPPRIDPPASVRGGAVAQVLLPRPGFRLGLVLPARPVPSGPVGLPDTAGRSEGRLSVGGGRAARPDGRPRRASVHRPGAGAHDAAGRARPCGDGSDRRPRAGLLAAHGRSGVPPPPPPADGGADAARRFGDEDAPVRGGKEFISAVERRAGWGAVDLAWQSPEALPTRTEIADPESWLVRVG